MLSETIPSTHTEMTFHDLCIALALFHEGCTILDITLMATLFPTFAFLSFVSLILL